MPIPVGWDAAVAIRACRRSARRRSAWRFHNRRYEATDAAGSLRFSGRYNRGLDEFPADQTWPALYLALAPEISIAENLRHVASWEQFTQLNDFVLTEISVKPTFILDCRDIPSLRLSLSDLGDDYDYDIPQRLAEAALARGAEGILVPSTTGLGDNLVLFPTQFRVGTRLEVDGLLEGRSFARI
jgi:RES domain-containing protein